ncbi:MAG: nucleotidyltransferase domain-containing protein [Nitrososphaeria archaeon]
MRERLSNSADIRLFKMDFENVLEFLRSYAKKLVFEGKAELVVLFGSLARGDYTAFSDADVLIIAENVPKLPWNRFSEYLETKSPVDIEPRILTKEEFYRMAVEKSMLVKEVLEYGIVLAGDPIILDKAKILFQKS